MLPPATATSASPGGGARILEYVNAGLIDEFSIALSPCFDDGIRQTQRRRRSVALHSTPISDEPSPRVTHLTYAVRQR